MKELKLEKKNNKKEEKIKKKAQNKIYKEKQ